MAKTRLGLWMVALMVLEGSVLSQLGDDLLLPYQSQNGDQTMPPGDDTSVEVTLDFEFPFFDQNHRTLFLNDNGVLSFLNEEVEYTPTVFPLDDKRLIAPFWADVNTDVAGQIYYREDRHTEILKAVDGIIKHAFPVKFSRFKSSWTFVATWHQVAFYNNRLEQLKPINNTFQAVLASDGLHSFTIFNYEKIEWTTGLSSFGDKTTGSATSNRSVAAQVGFNAGDGVNYFAVKGSRTQEVKNITRTSNVGLPGRWVFRTDSAKIESAGCEESLQDGLEISPVEVNMLGGDILAISGPCYLETHDIFCRVDGVVTRASYNLTMDPFTVQCITPVFMRLGEALVEVSLDGGESFFYNDTVTIVPLEKQPGLIGIADERISWQDGDTPFDFSREAITNVDIILYGYMEDSVGQVIKLQPIKMLKKNIPLIDGGVVVDTSQMEVAGVDVGIIRIVESGRVDMKEDVISWSSSNKPKRSSGLYDHPAPIPALWSMPFNTNPVSPQSGSVWCRAWARGAEKVVLRTDDPVVDCPCLMDQVLRDKGRFEVLSGCRGDEGDIVDSCKFRAHAQLCMRARFGSPLLGRGQLCCYDNHGHLINLQDHTSGGAVQSRHHSGFKPNYEVGNIPYFSNFLHDTIPWEECCGKTDKLTDCKAYSKLRPSRDCTKYSPPGIASVYGEPHFQSWDNRSYIFNGYGEYQLVTLRRGASDGPNIQARMEQVIPDFGATGVTAVAGQLGDSDSVQVEVSQRRDIDVWIYLRGKGKWYLPSFTRSDYYFANGVIVQVYRNTTDEQLRTGAFVTFSDGSSIDVKLPSSGSSLNVLINLSPNLKSNVWGLLGTWDNDSRNDFTLRDGNSMSNPKPTLLYQLLLDWQISEFDSILRYANGQTASSYLTASTDFVPITDLASRQGITEKDIEKVCGSSDACRFDYLKTGDKQQGKNARSAQEAEWDTRQGLVAVVSCGYITPPANGIREGDVYIVGHSVLFICKDGFIMTGSQVRTCEASGTWSGNTTSCIERETVKEVDLLLWIMIGLAAGLLMSLLFFCLLLLCCVCSRRRDIKQKQKVIDSAYKLEASVISHTNGIMMEDTSSYNNDNGLINNGHVITENGHVVNERSHVNGHVINENGQRHAEVITTNSLTPPEEALATLRRGSVQSVRFAGQMSFGEQEEEGISHAQIRKQSEVAAMRHGHVQRTPSLNQAGPSRGSKTLPPPVKPKPKAKSNGYKDLPMSHLDSADEEFKTARIVENNVEDEIKRIKQQLRGTTQRH